MDFVTCSADLTALQTDAQRLGFWNPAANNGAGDFITQGRIPGDSDPYASYFLNIVGVVNQPTGATTVDGMGNTVPVIAPIPGYWARLRINGDNPFRPGGFPIPPTLTVYALVTPTDGTPAFWSADGGATHAPSYVGGIGDIA